jgi:micrococcal nuclease
VASRRARCRFAAPGRRVNCVVDGDTLWLDGEKIRIVNIDAPEVNGRCRAEKVRAADATQALARLVSNRPIRVCCARAGTVTAARSHPSSRPRAMSAPRSSPGVMAVHWRGRREPAQTWCGA